jgi:hypothetical protein
MVELTIGMATYNDFDGVYFTLQALRLYQDLTDTELLVVDNYGCEHTKAFVEGWAQGRYVLATEAVGTAAAKNQVFAEARGEAVLCCDSHVLFPPGTIARLKAYHREHSDTRNLLQGPLVYDDLQAISTHFDPIWRGQMWGIWGTDPRGLDPEGDPFEIWAQGMGVFSCRKAAWPGFHPAFRGFGGEEGYIHEKVRLHGGRCLCLPWLRWGHRFERPTGVPYSLSIEDKLRNFVIGHVELGLELQPVLEHFAEFLSQDKIDAITTEAVRVHRASMVTEALSPVGNGSKVDVPQVGAVEMRRQRSSDARHVFSAIHDGNLWQAASVSGPGSTLDATAIIRDELASLFRDLNIRVLSDAPCGDASWITLITGGLDYYFGFDIVEGLIIKNLASHDRMNHFFRVGDVSSDVLPKSDAILCRDCLGHLPSQMGIAAINNFKKSNSTYLIATSFPTVTDYVEQHIGGWWPLNLTIAPYNLPPPMCYLREREVDPNDPYNDKSLGVWRLSDL